MKRFCCVMAVILLTVICFYALTSCGEAVPNSDPDKVVEKLKNLGYEDIHFEKDSGYGETIVQAYKYKEQTIIVDEESGISERIIVVEEMIEIYWFSELAGTMDEYLEGIKLDFANTKKKTEERLKELKDWEVREKAETENMLDVLSRVVFGKKDNMVWVGTKQAVIDAQ